MGFYDCDNCNSTVALSGNEKPVGNKSVACPRCHFKGIRRGDRNRVAIAESHADITDLRSAPRPRKLRIVGAVGRSPSAPPIAVWPPNPIHGDVTYIDDLTKAAWVNPGNAVCLAYNALDPNNAAMQGLVIDLPALAHDAQAQQHFAEVKHVMVRAYKPTDITEATGEAAAAMCVLANYPNYRMHWGMYGHTGPGIDQIWLKTGIGGAIEEILIVEAKGPNAMLNANSTMPPSFAQMSENWIVHNLAMMMNAGHSANKAAEGTLASNIVNALGLEVGVTYPVFAGASKSYYGTLSFTPARKTARIFGLTVTATWQGDGMLGYATSGPTEITVFTPTPQKWYKLAKTRYPRTFTDATAAKITYP